MGRPRGAVKHLKGLGATLASGFGPSHEDAETRALQALATNQRTRRSVALNCASRPISPSLKRLRTSAIGALWGRGRSKRDAKLVVIMCSEPIKADPGMAAA